jgi:hypothetical protein
MTDAKRVCLVSDSRSRNFVALWYREFDCDVDNDGENEGDVPWVGLPLNTYT